MWNFNLKQKNRYEIIMNKLSIILLFVLLLTDACTSGKAALKSGNYYEAVIESINRLRGNPTHKKATEVLQVGYPLAIEFIQSEIQNGMSADDPRKWRNAVGGYQKINSLNQQIKTSPGAMKIISNPVTKFKELAEAKVKAAEESYNEGIQFMLKNTREDAKLAYYRFQESNGYEPGYREVVELMNQAEFNATLRVAYQEINASRVNYGSIQPIILSLQRQFLSFKPLEQQDTVAPHQILKIVFNEYRIDNKPQISTRSEELKRDVKVGEKKGADGKTQDVMESVSGTITYFTKSKRAFCGSTFTITDTKSSGILQNNMVDGNSQWQNTWATYKGDVRAMTNEQLTLTKRGETSPDDQALFNQAISNLKDNLSQQLKSFYSRY